MDGWRGGRGGKVIGEAVTEGEWWTRYQKAHLKDNIWSSVDENGNRINFEDRGSHALLYFLENLLFALVASGQMRMPDAKVGWPFELVQSHQKKKSKDAKVFEPKLSRMLLIDNILDCIPELFTRQTTYTANRMPEYYKTKMTSALSHAKALGDFTQRDFLKLRPDLVAHWRPLPRWKGSDSQGDTWESAFVEHMWHVLNDPYKKT